MVLNGTFNISCLVPNELPDMNMETYCVDLETGKETLLEANFNIYNYKFNLGDKKYIKILNNSCSYQFNTHKKEKLEFPILAGNFSVYIQSQGSKPGINLQTCTFTVFDYHGRNLLSEDYNYLITKLSLNGTLLSDTAMNRVINNKLALLVDPGIINKISFSWINTNGHWSKGNFMIFPGDQIITVW